MSKYLAFAFGKRRDWDCLWWELQTHHLGRLTQADRRRAVVLGMRVAQVKIT